MSKQHSETKQLLESSAFFSKSDISLPSKTTNGIIGIFLIFKNLFTIGQYASGVYQDCVTSNST